MCIDENIYCDKSFNKEKDLDKRTTIVIVAYKSRDQCKSAQMRIEKDVKN